MSFQVPTRKNRKLERLLKHINEDAELLQLWKCANVNIKYLDDITAIYNAHAGCVRTMESDKGAKQKYMDYISRKYGR